jgi:hypothetical protein
MRSSQTFVLRLLADPEDPEALRGMLHWVATGEERHFSDGLALLDLLRQVTEGPTGGGIAADGTVGTVDHRERSEP